MKKMTLKVLGMFLLCILSATVVMAQEPCEGNFDYDQDVDGSDAAVFKDDFGRSPFNEPCQPPNSAPAPVPKTGQNLCYGMDRVPIPCTGTGQDGEYQNGVAWPNPRFTDNEDGTITDNLSGLIWLKNADCFGRRTWNDALSDCDGLAGGSCGLTDGSSAGDWRLPNKRELISLTHDGYYSPSLPNTAGTGQWFEGDPFTNLQPYDYWSSTSTVENSTWAWIVIMDVGVVVYHGKSSNTYVWPVRGGH